MGRVHDTFKSSKRAILLSRHGYIIFIIFHSHYGLPYHMVNYGQTMLCIVVNSCSRESLYMQMYTYTHN